MEVKLDIVDLSVEVETVDDLTVLVKVEVTDEVTVVDIATTGSKEIPTSAQLPGVPSSSIEAGKFVGEGTPETAYSA